MKHAISHAGARSLSRIALCAAVIAVCSQIIVPLPMIPINLGLFAVFLAGGLLGPKQGVLAVLVWLALGACGVPVFAGFQGGLSALVGKTGGFIVGYLFCALATGLAAQKSIHKLWMAMFTGTLLCYACGTIWFMQLTGLGLWLSLSYCVFPFVIGDALKAFLAGLLTVRIRKSVNWSYTN